MKNNAYNVWVRGKDGKIAKAVHTIDENIFRAMADKLNGVELSR